MVKPLFPCYDGWGSQGYHSGHKAIDIGWLTKYSKNGKTKVYACLDGKVIQAGQITERVNGKLVHPIVVVLQHDYNGYRYFTRYWHLDKVKCKKGDKVVRGQVIGIRGCTGYTSGNAVHLHFEVLKTKAGTKYSKCTGNNWFRYNINPINFVYIDSKVNHFSQKGNFKIRKVE